MPSAVSGVGRVSGVSGASGVSEKGFVPTVLLCFFLGVLGVHRFYVGKIGTGILQLVTVGGLGIWAMIDFIMIIVGKFTDRDGRAIKPR
jgi:TM2 domain-containing membrane protein YozV